MSIRRPAELPEPSQPDKVREACAEYLDAVALGNNFDYLKAESAVVRAALESVYGPAVFTYLEFHHIYHP